MNNRLLGIRGHEVSDLRAVVGDAEAVDPMLPDRHVVWIIIGITLEVIDQKIRTDRKAPDRPFDRISSIDLIDAPIVRGIRLKQAGVIALGPERPGSFVLGRGRIGAAHGVLVQTEIYLM